MLSQPRPSCFCLAGWFPVSASAAPQTPAEAVGCLAPLISCGSQSENRPLLLTGAAAGMLHACNSFSCVLGLAPPGLRNKFFLPQLLCLPALEWVGNSLLSALGSLCIFGRGVRGQFERLKAGWVEKRVPEGLRAWLTDPGFGAWLQGRTRIYGHPGQATAGRDFRLKLF